MTQDRGDLTAAQHAYTQALAIFQMLTGPDPGNTDWLQELGLAYCRFGDVAQERGDPRAKHAFVRYQAVFERLTELDPANADWRRELAAARRRSGG